MAWQIVLKVASQGLTGLLKRASMRPSQGTTWLSAVWSRKVQERTVATTKQPPTPVIEVIHCSGKSWPKNHTSNRTGMQVYGGRGTARASASAPLAVSTNERTHVSVELTNEGREIVVLEVFRKHVLGELANVPNHKALACLCPANYAIRAFIIDHVKGLD